MPAAQPTLTLRGVLGYVEEHCTAPVTGKVGLELEWLTFATDGSDRRLTIDELRDAVRSTSTEAGLLPSGSRLTFEPGGQLEISTAPQPSVAAACDVAAGDSAAVKAAAAGAGIALIGLGADPVRPNERVVDEPRYAAMEAFFDGDNGHGRTMMCGTASVQVNVDAGRGDEADRRWDRIHALLPVLAGAFASSPLLLGRPTGWKSARLATWDAMDATRTAAAWRAGAGLVESWAAYALGARVMLVRGEDGRCRPVPDRRTFGEWLARGGPHGWPTLDDLAYHLTTLFPPVRPKGWLEIRILDALPEPWWTAAAGVAVALMDDDEAAAVADEASGATAGLLPDAIRGGLDHPALATAATACVDAAVDGLERMGAAAVASMVDAFADRYTRRGRCPADDALDEWARTGWPADATSLVRGAGTATGDGR